MEIKEYYNLVKDHCISLYRTGSRVIPFITNVRDEDYFIYCENEDDIEYCKKIKMEHREELQHKCIFFSIRNEMIMARWSYLYHYLQLLEGEDLHINEQFDILKYKEEYIECLKSDKFLLNKFVRYEENDLSFKLYYYVLMGLYIIENDSYDLSREQKENICVAHARKLPIELYEYIKNKLYKEDSI